MPIFSLAFRSRRHVPEPRRAAQDNLTPPWRDDRTPLRYRRQLKPDEFLQSAAIEAALFQSGSTERFQGFPLNGSEIEIDVCVHGASKLALFAHAIQIRREACATVMSREFDPAAQPGRSLQPNHALAAIFARQEADQGLRRVFQAVDHIFLNFQFAGTNP